MPLRPFTLLIGICLACCGCHVSPLAMRGPEVTSHPIQTGLVEPESENETKNSDPTYTVQPVGFTAISPSETQTAEQMTDLPLESTDESVEPSDADGLAMTPPLSLEQAEALALANQPALTAAAATIESLRGKHLQVGLPPNRTAGIMVDDLGEGGNGGRYGVYFGRKIIRGNKLGLAQNTVCAEITVAEQRYLALEQKVLTDVRQMFFQTLIAQKRMQLATDMVELSKQSLATSEKLESAGEVSRSVVLQSNVELEQTKLRQQRADNQWIGARRRLAAFTGQSDLTAGVTGSLDALMEMPKFEESFELLLATSPELGELAADIERAKRALSRAEVEAVPDVTWQTYVQYEQVEDDIVTGFQVGMPIPRFDRNQGAVHQARQQVIVAEQTLAKRRLALQNRLTTAFQDLTDAKIQVDAIRTRILPGASETLELTAAGYEQGAASFLQLLAAQRTFIESNLSYMDQLGSLLQKKAEIDGLLLNDSLQ